MLQQNYPNPFNLSTYLKFAVAETQNAELKVFDILGNEVATLFNSIAEGGKIYEVEFNRYSGDVRNLPAGRQVYQAKFTFTGLKLKTKQKTSKCYLLNKREVDIK